MKTKWIVLISQTGREVMNISNYLSLYPKCIITTKIKNIDSSVVDWAHNNNIPIIEQHNSLLPLLTQIASSEYLITLHGYLKIIPKEVIDKYPHIYNCRPGLITKHKELKGLHPQEKARQLKHSIVGSVVHRVVEEVDSGEVIVEHATSIAKNTCYYNTLKNTSFMCWRDFFLNTIGANVLVGTHGVGKTTILNELRKYLPYIYVSDGFSRPVHSVSFDKEHQQTIINVLTKWRWENDYDKICMFSRSVIDAFVYTKVLKGYEDSELIGSYLRYKDRYRFFYIPIEIPLEKDGIRYEDEQLRKEIDQELLNFLHKYDVKYTTLSGTIEERIQTLAFNILSPKV